MPSDNIYFYKVHGLNIESDFALPGISISNPKQIDLKFSHNQHLNIPVLSTADQNEDFVYIDDSPTTGWIIWPEICAFNYDLSNSSAVYRSLIRKKHNKNSFPTNEREVLSIYLATQIISHFLPSKKLEGLHGTVVSYKQEGTLLLLGDCGSGKSTLAAFLLSKGWSIVTDDLAVFNQESSSDLKFFPGGSRLKLFEDSYNKILADRKTMGRMNPFTEKRIIELKPPGSSLPCKAIIILNPSKSNPLNQDFSVKELSKVESYRMLIRHIFNPLQSDIQRLKHSTKVLAPIAKNLNFYQVNLTRNWKSLDSIYDPLINLIHRGNWL